MKISGIVVPNKRNGTKFGYPTANIAFADRSVDGLFVGYTKLLSAPDVKMAAAFAGRSLPSIIFIGAAETIEETEHRLESHIMDFPLIDLYYSEIEVITLGRLRDNQKFESVEKLIEQMKKDEQNARAWLLTMLDERFIALAVVIDLAGGADYVIDTLKGRIKPNKVTWFLWALIPAIALTGMINEHADSSTMILTFCFGLVPLIVFIASFFNKKSFWKISRTDVACGVLACVGILAWIVTKDGNVAIIFSMLANFFAWLPTAGKSFKNPETENWRAFLCGAVASFITLLTVNEWTFASSGFPIYFTLSCAVTVLLIRYKPGLKLQKT